MERYGPAIEQMQERDRVSEALAAAAKATRQTQREQGRLHLSWVQAAIGIIAAAATVATLILTTLHHH